MTSNSTGPPVDQLRTNYQSFVSNWIASQKPAGATSPDLISDADLRRPCSELLGVGTSGRMSRWLQKTKRRAPSLPGIRLKRF